jgi:hypothetical protein
LGVIPPRKWVRPVAKVGGVLPRVFIEANTILRLSEDARLALTSAGMMGGTPNKKEWLWLLIA